jgi:hypothetical protein
MRNTPLLITGIALLLVGLIGMGLTGAILSGGSVFSGTKYSSDGQRIYYTGADVRGRPIPRTIGGVGLGSGMAGMNHLACVDCHGEDGRGRVFRMMMWGGFKSSDIRYSTLTAPHSDEGRPTPGWSDADIARAIREGVEPNGERLNPPMPRWEMTDAQMQDVIAHLKELSK